MDAITRSKLLDLNDEYWNLIREWNEGKRTVQLNERLANIAKDFEELGGTLAQTHTGHRWPVCTCGSHVLAGSATCGSPSCLVEVH